MVDSLIYGMVLCSTL